MHGYDNAVGSMHAIFMATGPAFVKNYTMDPFDSVELFRLFGRLLGIDLAALPPNNGTCSHGLHIIRPTEEDGCERGLGSKSNVL